MDVHPQPTSQTPSGFLAPPPTRYVVGFALDPDAEVVLLIRKNRPAWQAGLLNGPGGKVEGRETRQEAVAREFLEETAIETEPREWEDLCELRGPGFVVSFLRTRIPHEKLAAASDRTAPTDELLEVRPLRTPGPDVVPNLGWLLPVAQHRPWGSKPLYGLEAAA